METLRAIACPAAVTGVESQVGHGAAAELRCQLLHRRRSVVAAALAQPLVDLTPDGDCLRVVMERILGRGFLGFILVLRRDGGAVSLPCGT
jgi:hypothetical protein